MTPVSPPPDGEEMEKASVSWTHQTSKIKIILNPDLASGVGDAAEAALMPHTNGVFLVAELQALTLL